MAKADLHLHTDFSDGLHSPREMVQAASRAGLEFIAVTDHDTMEGAFRAQEYAKRRSDLKVEVILGEEISTLNGHVVGLFLNSFIPPRLTAKRTVELIHQQGGIAILAHPFHLYTGKYPGHERAVDILPEIQFDGIETVNHGDALSFWSNRKASKVMRQSQLSTIGCSDAHSSRFIGMGYTEFAGTTAQDLKRSIEDRTAKACYARSWKINDILVHLKNAAPVLARYSKVLETQA
ncbi:MAG TPA: CehA/McbA family metallohydrolase [bacterium]|nr:CehA/McbA family metallohydrolase [bacterium]